MKATLYRIKTQCETVLCHYQQLAPQQRLIAVVVASIMICGVLLLCLRHTDPMYSMEPHHTIYVKGPIEDTASRDTPEEALNRVAIEYNKVVKRVDVMAREQRIYQKKLERTLQTLQEEVNTLKAALKRVQAEQRTLKDAKAHGQVLPASSKPATELTEQQVVHREEKNTAVYPTGLLSAAKATLMADTQPAVQSPADTPITLVNDLSLPVGAKQALPPALPPAPRHRQPLHQPVVKAKRATEPIQNTWPNVGDTTLKRVQVRQDMQQAFDRLSGHGDTKTKDTTDTAADETIPYYTLPANATGLQAQLMTALVGRIPVHGHVQDPYPFKIILGQENLAANGLKVPNVSGMIVSGFAVGDMTLRSVKGWITSVTFVFPDGRIHTVQSGGQGSRLPTAAGSLGYLSDPYGNPFLPGRLITNAPTEIATTLALGSAQGLAGGLLNQSVINVAPHNKAPQFKPEKKHFSRWLLGNTAAQTTASINQWWQARHSGSFDAIYVPAGKSVVINFTREIPIDYHKQGRKLNYEHTQTIQSTVSTVSLSPDADGLD